MNKDTKPAPVNGADKAGKITHSITDSGSLITSIQKEVLEFTLEASSNLLDKYITKENAQLFKDLLRLDQSRKYTRPEIFVSIGAGRVATLGNLSLGIGKQKSGKTQMVSLIVASVLCSIYGTEFKYSDIFIVNRPVDKNIVIWFDTEQDEYDVQLVFNRLRKLTGSDILPNLHVYALRDRTPEERLIFISDVLKTTPECCLAIIDGVVDLGYDPILDPKEATLIVTELMKLSKRSNVHILSILHQNKQDNHAKGHIGAFYQNKCELCFSVEKDKSGLRVVKAEMARGKEFEPFVFSITEDEEGNAMPEIMDDYSPTEPTASKRKLTAYDIPKETHYKVLVELFGNDGQMKYKDLEDGLSVKFQSYSVNLTHTQVVQFITYYDQQQMLFKSGSGGRAGKQYIINHNHFR
jgi:hypothetical protein